MTKHRILQEFNILTCVIDTDTLEKYIDFCLENSHVSKIPGETSTHHILPQAKTLPFGQFKNLKEHKWNAAELSYYDHYYAHYLLTLAIDHIAVLYSFVAMHNADVKNGRLSQSDLIEEATYNLIFKSRNHKISKRQKEIIEVDGIYMTRSSYHNSKIKRPPQRLRQMSDSMAGGNNIVHKDGVVNKIRSTKLNTIIDGKNLDKISSERAAQTMRAVITTESGAETTIYKLAAAKHSETLNKPFMNESGEITTLAKEYGKQRAIRMIQQGKWYILRNVFDPNLVQRLPAIEIRAISPGLEKCTKDNYLGKSKFGQNVLTKKGKASLIGLYVERCE